MRQLIDFVSKLWEELKHEAVVNFQIEHVADVYTYNARLA